VSIGPGTLQLTLALTQNGISAIGSGSFKAEVNSEDYVQANVTVALSVDVVSGKLAWSGTASASGKLVLLGLDAGSVSVDATVDNNEIEFNFGHGIKLTIPLP
jgi:hypothetical protein